jgi:hypothetical protein
VYMLDNLIKKGLTLLNKIFNHTDHLLEYIDLHLLWSLFTFFVSKKKKLNSEKEENSQQTKNYFLSIKLEKY